eukprot:196473-Amphidinium_carterae.1
MENPTFDRFWENRGAPGGIIIVTSLWSFGVRISQMGRWVLQTLVASQTGPAASCRGWQRHGDA